MDETYIKVHGQWKYLDRAVDKDSDTVDFLFRTHQDKAAAGFVKLMPVDYLSGASVAFLQAYQHTHSRITSNGVQSLQYLEGHRAASSFL